MQRERGREREREKERERGREREREGEREGGREEEGESVVTIIGSHGFNNAVSLCCCLNSGQNSKGL